MCQADTEYFTGQEAPCRWTRCPWEDEVLPSYSKVGGGWIDFAVNFVV